MTNNQSYGYRQILQKNWYKLLMLGVIIMDSIKEEYKDKTVIVIAHKLTTIIDVQKIYLMKHGKIISCGSHKELLKKSDDYRILYESQFVK